MSLDSNRDGSVFVSADLNGKITIYTQFDKIKINVRNPVHQVCLVPNQGVYLKIAVATFSKGVMMIDTKDL